MTTVKGIARHDGRSALDFFPGVQRNSWRPGFHVPQCKINPVKSRFKNVFSGGSFVLNSLHIDLKTAMNTYTIRQKVKTHEHPFVLAEHLICQNIYFIVLLILLLLLC